MIKRLIFGLMFAVMAWAAPAMAQVQTAADVAGRLQSLVGKEYEGGLKFISVVAEDKTLVLTIDGQTGWNGVTQDEITQIFMGGFCADPDGAKFLKTSWIRIDTLDHGANLSKGKPTNTCPPPEEAK